MFDWMKRGEKAPEPRKGMPSPRLNEAEFKRRYRERFYDPAFDKAAAEIETVAEIAWQAYKESRKSPCTRKAGEGYADPEYDLSAEWIAAKEAVDAAQRRHKRMGRLAASRSSTVRRAASTPVPAKCRRATA